MAIARVKVWVVEVLTASDLNAEFDNIINNGQSVSFPRTAAADFDGQELILDSDGDTSITADTDDRIDFRVGGSDVMYIDAGGLFLGGSRVATANSLDVVALRQRVSMLEAQVSELLEGEWLNSQIYG